MGNSELATQKYIDYALFLALYKSSKLIKNGDYYSNDHQFTEKCFLIGGRFEQNLVNVGIIRDLMNLDTKVVFLAYSNSDFDYLKQALSSDMYATRIVLFSSTNKYIYSYILDLCLFFDDNFDELSEIKTMLNSFGKLFYSASPLYDAPSIEESAKSTFDSLGEYDEGFKTTVLGIDRNSKINKSRDLYLHIHGVCFDDIDFEKFYHSDKRGYEQFLYIVSLAIKNECFFENVKKINYKSNLYHLGYKQYLDVTDKKSFLNVI